MSTDKKISDLSDGGAVQSGDLFYAVRSGVDYKIQGSSLSVTVADTTSIDLTLAGTQISGAVVPGGVDHNSLLNYASNRHFLQTDITNISTALSTGLLKVTTGTGDLSVITDSSSSWNDAYSKRVDTWGDGLSYSTQTASVDYNSTNLKITSNQINTIQDISTSSTPTFNSITINNSPTNNSDAARKDYVDSLIQGLDWQESVKDRYDPSGGTPGTPSTGDRYISTATANGWTNKYIYEYTGATWDETIPNEGYASWVEDEDILYVYNSSDWVKFGSTVTHNNLSGLQGGTTNQYYHLTSTEHGYLSGQDQNVTSLGSPTFVTISPTTINAFSLGGKLSGGAYEIEGSNFDIDGGNISSCTISGGLTWSSAQDLNNQILTNVNIDSGSIDAITLGTNSAITEAQIDSININGNSIGSTSGDLSIYAPNSSSIIVNTDGNDVDFIINGETNDNLFVVDGRNERVSINNAAPDFKFEITGGSVVDVFKVSSTNNNAEQFVEFVGAVDACVTLKNTTESAGNGELYWEIIPGATASSWKTGTNDDTKYHIAYGEQGTMNSQEKVTVLSTGEFGIANTNPKSDLQIGDGFNFFPVGSGASLNSYIGQNVYYDSGFKRTFAENDAAMIGFGSSSNLYFYFASDENDTADSEISWTQYMSCNKTEIAINNNGAAIDFRVESDNDANCLFVDGSADKVGIGIHGPASKLHIKQNNVDAADNGTVDQFALLIFANNGGAANNTENGLAFGIYTDDSSPAGNTPGGAITFERTAAWSQGKLHFKTKRQNTEGGNLTTAMTIDDSGYVGIGINSPDKKLHIHEATASTECLLKFTNAQNTDGFQLGINSQDDCVIANLDADSDMIFYTGGANQRMKISASGGINISALGTGTVYSNSGSLTNVDPSREEWKEDITDIGSVLADINGLKPRHFRYTEEYLSKEDGAVITEEDRRLRSGFIMEEVKHIFPEICNADGIYSAELMPYIIKAIQELSLDIEQIHLKLADCVKGS